MTAYTRTHAIGFQQYSVAEMVRLVRERPQLSLQPAVAERIARGASYVARKCAEDIHIYGVNSGFGALCETRIAPEEMERLQHNFLMSHAVGVGELIDPELSLLTILVKLLTLRAGTPGVTLECAQRLLDLWNYDVVPAIPKKGTLGASGDLAPLAHMSLPLIGLGEVFFRGKLMPAGDALRELGWRPLRLQPKEGLALTNGVQYINALGAHAVARIADFARSADVLAALSSQAFSTSETFYSELYQTTSLHPERMTVARNLTRLMAGSNHSQLQTCNRSKQDPYSFRCIPQVHGATRQVLRFAIEILERECNSVSDNPQFFAEEDAILYGGALHGESTAIALDALALGASELAQMSERRTYQLLSGRRGLPDFLVGRPGLNSGLMVAQYTSAAMINENKVLCTPASVDTIPSCQLQEDHVSMGGTCAYKLAQIADNSEFVFAIELMAAAQAIDLNPALQLSPATRRIHEEYRAVVPMLNEDRVLETDIDTSRRFFLEQQQHWASSLELS
jgi:histidine ammonia-lyase